MNLQKWVMTAAAAMAVAVPATASAEGLYARAEAGVSFGEIEDDEADGSLDLEQGYLVGGALGYELVGGLSFEGEVLYAKNDIDTEGTGISADTSLTAALANVIYRLPTVGPIAPFIGAGVGYGDAEVSAFGESESESDLVYQVKGGGAFAISPNTSIDLTYRYLTGEFDGAEIKAHGVTGGVRFKFG